MTPTHEPLASIRWSDKYEKNLVLIKPPTAGVGRRLIFSVEEAETLAAELSGLLNEVRR